MEEELRVTVFTPTYNRERSIHRVYESLIKQTYRNFIWLIIDDGSTDNTKKLIDSYIEENKIKIKYIYQENQGKHIAVNNAVQMCDTELFLIADSDDAFVSEALEVFIKAWDSIENKSRYKGVIARCYDADTKRVIGNKFPAAEFDLSELEANFKYKLYGEKWSIFRTEVLKEFPFPEIKGIKFYPETILWQKIARKYITKYIDIPLREYFRDQNNSLTRKENKKYKENIYLWEHCINNVFDFFWYNPMFFVKSFVGLSRDGLRNGYTFCHIIQIPNTFMKKIAETLFFPIGFYLYKTSK